MPWVICPTISDCGWIGDPVHPDMHLSIFDSGLCRGKSTVRPGQCEASELIAAAHGQRTTVTDGEFQDDGSSLASPAQQGGAAVRNGVAVNAMQGQARQALGNGLLVARMDVVRITNICCNRHAVLGQSSIGADR